MLNPTLIQQFNSAPHAIHNDGSLEQLREVMKELFPKDNYELFNSAMYYYESSRYKGEWVASSGTTLPIIPVTSFFTQPGKMVKVSDVVKYIEANSNINDNGYKSVEYYDLKQYLNELP